MGLNGLFRLYLYRVRSGSTWVFIQASASRLANFKPATKNQFQVEDLMMYAFLHTPTLKP